MTLIEGNPESRVRILLYEDLQCGDCLRFRQMLDSSLLPRFGSRVAFVHKDFPLPKHPLAMPAAVAARHWAALDPAAAVAFRRQTLQKGKDRIQTPEAMQDHIASFARRHHLDVADAEAAGSLAEAVKADVEEGRARGVAKTPTVYVDDRAYVEAFTLEEITDAIEKAASA